MTRPFPDDTLLMAYADGELDAEAAEAVEAAIAADPAVRARVAMFAGSADYLREAFAERDFVGVPPGLERQLRRATWVGRARRSARIILPMAAAIAGFAIGMSQLPRLTGWMDGGATASIASTIQEVAEYHALFTRETEHLVEVPATRQAHIEEWLGNRVGYPLHVPDLSARGLTFVGARMLAVNARPVAQLMYTTANGERVALCVTEQEIPATTALLHSTEHGFDMYAQGEGRHLFIIAAPAGMALAKSLSTGMTELLRRG